MPSGPSLPLTYPVPLPSYRRLSYLQVFEGVLSIHPSLDLSVVARQRRRSRSHDLSNGLSSVVDGLRHRISSERVLAASPSYQVSVNLQDQR